MVIFSAKQNDTIGKAVYVAVPTKPSLSQILAQSEWKDKFFPYMGTPDFIDARKAIIESDNGFTDLTLTYSKRPFFDPNLYELSDKNLQGHTTLHVSAMQTCPSDIVDKILSLFPDVIQLDMKQNMQPKFSHSFHGLLVEFEKQRPFFESYATIRKNLLKSNKLKNKRIERGIFVDLMQRLLTQNNIENFPQGYDVRLVNRTEVHHGSMPLELSLIYVTGPRIYPSVYGVFLSEKHTQGCPAWETKDCDQSRSYAGYLFSPDNLIFGGSVLLPEAAISTYKDHESGPTGEFNFCLKGSYIIPRNKSWAIVESKIDEFPDSIGFSSEQLDEIKVITKLVYGSTEELNNL